MPVTIANPPVGGQFGPGFFGNWTSDFVGPLDPGWFWRWNFALAATPESPFFQGGVDNNGTRGFSGQIATTPSKIVVTPFPDAHQWDPIVFWVELVELGLVVDQSSRIAVTYNQQAGTQWSINERVGTSTTGALTPAQDQALMSFPLWAIWDLVGDFAPGLFDLIRDKVGAKYNKILYSPIRDGIGTLDKPAIGPFFRWVGIEWEVFFAPEGLGIDLGNPETHEVNWGQLSYVRENADGSFAASDTNYEGRLFAQWVWGTNEPHHIGYYILPGVQIRFWALTLLEPAASSAGNLTSSTGPEADGQSL